jgi:DNA-binding NarL/FixJ family response regulator
MRPRILLADDHRILADGLKTLFSPEFELIGVVDNGRALLQTARKEYPDAIVLDISMPGLNGLDALVQLKKWNPAVKVVILTMHHEPAYARRALEAGAKGYVLKHSAASELLAAIRAALDGRTYISAALAAEVMRDLRDNKERATDPASRLTPRQREILQLFAEGKSAKEIGSELGISGRTVEFHKYQMMELLQFQTGADLIHFAIRHGIVSS